MQQVPVTNKMNSGNVWIRQVIQRSGSNVWNVPGVIKHGDGLYPRYPAVPNLGKSCRTLSLVGDFQQVMLDYRKVSK